MVENFKRMREIVLSEMEGAFLREPPKKKFKPKNQLPKLEDYKLEANESYWAKWEKLNWTKGRQIKSSIDANLLRNLGIQTKFPFPNLMEIIVCDVEEGAGIGISSECKVASKATNAPSAYDQGEKVSDEIASWIKKGFAIGPFKKEEVPFPVVKISGLMTKLKPNGAVRPILNFSNGRPKSVNEGINSKDYPTIMTSPDEWVRILRRCGRGARFCKNDWGSAYKQIRIKSHEVWMQGFEWLGRIFFELCLVFGCRSSPGIYDRLAKLVLWICLVLAGFPPHLALQHLDDVCAASPASCDLVDKFHNTYREVCKELGIELADTDDKDKAFAPRTCGQVLGINYDTEEGVHGTWFLSEEKLTIILIMLEKAISEKEMDQRFFKSICGKLIHLRCFVKDSRFKLSQIILAANQSSDLAALVEASEWCKSDMFWWKVCLPAYSRRTPLPDPDRKPGPMALFSHTDAAGGSVRSWGRGVGITIFPNTWTLVLWGDKINKGERSMGGQSLAHVMSAWELVGPLLTLCAAPDTVRAKQVVVMVDNEGSVRMYQKGWTTKCQLCNTLLVAINQVASALGVDLFVHKIRRCSNTQAKAADALSKMDLVEFRKCMPGAYKGPERVPRSLTRWIADPVPDRFLGTKILAEMSTFTQLLDYIQ